MTDPSNKRPLSTKIIGSVAGLVLVLLIGWIAVNTIGRV
jgi:hypothetical protein